MNGALTSEQWQAVWRIYDSASELPPDERAHILASASSDREVLREVAALLEKLDSSDGASRTEPKIPERLGRYVITGLLGRGGMGEVYSAEDTELSRFVALKFLTCAGEGTHSALRSFIREAKAASALNHPNIVTVHEVIYSGPAPAIVMELVEGEALRRLCGTPLPVDRAIRIAEQIALALAAAHARGIVHRDIKPENIMVRPDGYVKVLDFGLARQAAGGDGASTAGLPQGTLRYMSPEQTRGEVPTAAGDVFSLGIILYELVTGTHPFGGGSPFETVHAIATQPAKPPRATNHAVPAELDGLILAMLEKEIQARPDSREVARRLLDVRSPSAVPSRPGSLNRLWAGLAAALTIAVVGLWYVIGSVHPAGVADVSIRPLTSQPGWESSPAISPDGESVAFTWTGDLESPRQIYVKRLDADAPVKLTSSISEGNLGDLVWSPDGAEIAFKRRQTLAGGIYSIGKDGGAEKKIVELRNADLSASIDWSPDGTQLAFSDFEPDGSEFFIYLFNLNTGEKRMLTRAPKEDWGDWDPRFSPDGSMVAFKRVAGFLSDAVYVVPVKGGAVRQVAGHESGIWGHAWTPDGKALIVSSQKSGSIFGLWRTPLSGGAGDQRIVQGTVDAIMPVTARKSNRLAWVNETEDSNIYQTSTGGGGALTRLVASTVRDQWGAYSPDGRIAFSSDRSGSAEIWMAHVDGSNQVRVTNLNKPLTRDPRWSPDGRQLAFMSQLSGHPAIYIMPCEKDRVRCGDPKQLTTGNRAEILFSWSADGRYLYYASDQSGRFQVWKRPMNGGPGIQVTQSGGFAAFESRDGKWLYFTRADKENRQSIWLMPGPAGTGQPMTARQLIGTGYLVGNESWAVTPDDIFFVDRAKDDRSATIRAFQLATARVRPILTLNNLLPERAPTELSVSPDSRWLMFSRLDRSGSNIMVADIK